LSRAELDALESAEAALLADLAFEHLGDSVADKVWAFAARCAIERQPNFVQQFMTEHARDVESRSCYVAVDYLTVTSEVECVGIRFVPVDALEIPRHRAIPDAFAQTPGGSVAVVEVVGTDRERMVERGLARVDHALRVMRIAFREHHGVADHQLRFRRGRHYSLGSEVTGWRTPPEAAYVLELRQEFIDLTAQVEVGSLPSVPVTNIQRQADVAIRWMERAWFTGEPIVALLFLFFALEALLGDKSEGQKAHLLAFRQAMLSHVLTGGFPNPNRTLHLYDEVRSDAVHGEKQPEVDDRLVKGFAWTVRQTLNHFLRYAKEQRFTSRSQVLRALDNHPDRESLLGWLKIHGGPWWAEYGTTKDPD
jgi:hypothetical protein